MDTKMGKNCLGFYNPRLKCVAIRKGLSQKETEQVITHKVSHALWAIKTSLPTWLNLIINYWNKKKNWKEEQFAFYMEKKPSLVLHLFNQL